MSILVVKIVKKLYIIEKIKHTIQIIILICHIYLFLLAKLNIKNKIIYELTIIKIKKWFQYFLHFFMYFKCSLKLHM